MYGNGDTCHPQFFICEQFMQIWHLPRYLTVLLRWVGLCCACFDLFWPLKCCVHIERTVGHWGEELKLYLFQHIKLIQAKITFVKCVCVLVSRTGNNKHS